MILRDAMDWVVASKVFWSQKTAGGDSDEPPPAA